jgi:type 1 glutamine amidotransferase
MHSEKSRITGIPLFRRALSLLTGIAGRKTGTSLGLSLAAITLIAAPADLGRFFEPGKIRVLIFSGRNNHDWRASTPFLRSLLLKSGRFDVRICEEPSGTTADTLAPYDALVIDYGGPRWGEATEKAVESFVRSGKGMIAVHGASYMFSGLEVLADRHAGTGVREAPWPEYARMVGGHWPSPPPKGYHGQRHSFPVKLVRGNHPVLAGMPESFTATDELYHQMTFLPGTEILATAYDDPTLGGTGKDEPILTAKQYGKGRVFYTALGHDLAAMSEPGFINTFLRGTEWAATSKVSLAPNVAGTKPETPPLRLLVVTGGHDYETSFYTLFEGQDDVAWTHAASNKEAFRRDIRPGFDVLVLYDSSRELDEAGRTNLRAFVEGGKGVVVLHHAIVDYPDWAWWYRDVVGGRYLEKPDGTLPASSYKHDVELFVEPAMQHPVLTDVGQMHITDETYKGMWISPDVKVLLRTGHPTADGPVAWISPYQKSRVIYLQGGHDSAALRHPAYRKLVRNAILWSANRAVR